MNTDDEVTISVSGSAAEDRFPVSVSEERTATRNAVFTTDSTQSKTAIVEPENLRIVIAKPEGRSTNVTVHDVAAFIVNQQGEMTAMKLQKLVYYSQAWSLVWDDEPLFDEPIEAWANGPVIRALYARHQGSFKVNAWQGDPSKLTDSQRETILKVLEFYGPMAPQVLSDLTHSEEPWLKARVGLAVGERGRRVITHAEMVEYYSSL